VLLDRSAAVVQKGGRGLDCSRYERWARMSLKEANTERWTRLRKVMNHVVCASTGTDHVTTLTSP